MNDTGWVFFLMANAGLQDHPESPFTHIIHYIDNSEEIAA